MTQEERIISTDRMRYTKDKISSTLVLAAIVFDAMYFVSIYKSDVGSFYYNWMIGASIIYNLLFLLTAFLCSEGVKSRKTGYPVALVIIGALQFLRIFYLPAKARAALASVNGSEVPVMERGQYVYVLACLVLSAVCCLAAAVTSYRNTKRLNDYMRTLEQSKP